MSKIKFNGESEEFEATVLIGEKSHGLTLCDFTFDEDIKAEMLAENIFKWLKANLDLTKDYAASQLIALKNGA